MEVDDLEEAIYELATEYTEMDEDEEEETEEDNGEESSDDDGLTEEIAMAIGDELGIDWEDSPFDAEQFLMGIKVELEHGTINPETNVTDDDLLETAKIVWVHLKELDDYYYKLKEMEEDSDENGESDIIGMSSLNVISRELLFRELRMIGIRYFLTNLYLI